MANSNLHSSKKAKNDEFYTQYHDIEKEIGAYVEYNPDVFKDKVILMPCDDPEWSNFTKFFAQNFERLKIKKLISTSYAPDSKVHKNGYQPTLFELNDPQYDEKKTITNGKIFTLEQDKSGDGKIDVDDLEWTYLKGDGDFNSIEIKKLRDEADIIITNPPFSLFREFLAWIVEADKEFLLVGNMNALTYKEVFPLIKDNLIWLGVKSTSKAMFFKTSNKEYAERVSSERPEGSFWRMFDGEICIGINNSCWFTNLDHGRRHQPLTLLPEEDIIKFVTLKPFIKYDNYNAIEVSLIKNIPCDYDGIMGVPITFIDKYNPKQFEILGLSRYLKTEGMSKKFVDEYYKSGQTGLISEGHPDLCYYDHNNRPTVPYMRVLIKHKK